MSSRRRNPPSSDNRFYTAPSVLRHRQMLQQQQVPEESAEDQVEKCSGSTSDSISAVELSATPSVFSPSVSKVTNLDRLMESLAPFVPSRDSSAVISSVDSHPFFCLEDLWESFREWSVYGAEVPLLLNGKDEIVQYYAPSLSGIQLYKDPLKPSSQLSIASSSNAGTDGRGKSVVNSFGYEADYLIASSHQEPFFQYLEYEQPRNRQPLTDKIFDLESRNPELSKCRSCDLLPTSWLCVAWYPIYRIPVGPTLKEFEASFLSFYPLSTQSIGKFPPHFYAANARAVLHKPTDKKFSLPVFGLLSYKLRDSTLNPCGPRELEQEYSLLQAVDNWARHLQVPLPDYQFFRARCSYRR